MKRILESSCRRTRITFDIQLDQQKYYFRGDEVRGSILLESPKPIKIKNIRLQWYGRVRVQLEPGLRDERELFRETAYLDIPASENESEVSKRQAIKRAATTTTTLGIMIPTSPSKSTYYIDSDKLHTYPFSFTVPENPILPSCTESETSVGGIVEYVIEAYLERPTSDFSASVKAQIHVPVLQRIDTVRPELATPQSAHVECRQATSSQEEEKERITTLSASIPSKAFVRNQPMPVTVEIKHFEPYIRPQGLMIALIRTCRIVCKGVSYGLPDSVIHYIKADIDISEENDLSQTIKRNVLIPKSISPTVGVNARLFEIGYKVRVRAQLQDDNTAAEYNMSVINFPADFQSLAYMTAEIPIDIGTLPLPDNHIPPPSINPEFVDVFDSYIPAQAAKEMNTAEKVHMLKKMQRMLRRSSGQAPRNDDAETQDTQLPMTKTELLTLFSETESLTKRNSLNSSSDDSGSARGSTTTGSQSQTTITSGEQSTIGSSYKLTFPPPPSSPPPKVNSSKRPALPSFRLSLGPEFSAEVLSSELAKKEPPKKEEDKPTPSASSSTSLDHYKPSDTPIIKHDQFQHLHNQRRRINSDSIVMDTNRHSNIHTPPTPPPQASASEQTHEPQRKPEAVSVDGGVHYFYMFDDSASSSEEEGTERHQRQRRKSTRRRRATTAAGFEKPNSVSNNMDASEARVERPGVNSTTAASTSHIIDKPDEVTESDTDSQLSSDEDLLDILERRDKRLASRMTQQ